MANNTYKGAAFHVDNASAALTDISVDVTAVTMSRAINMLEDSAFQDEERTFLPGLAGTTLSVSFFVNTTTEAIYGPLVSDNTAITKTVAWRPYSGRFFKGETYVNNVQITGNVDDLITGSADHTWTGAVTRTSVVGT